MWRKFKQNAVGDRDNFITIFKDFLVALFHIKKMHSIFCVIISKEINFCVDVRIILMTYLPPGAASFVLVWGLCVWEFAQNVTAVILLRKNKKLMKQAREFCHVFCLILCIW